MAKLIRISPAEKRTVLHDTPGIGVSARRKHRGTGGGSFYQPSEYYAIRTLKAAGADNAPETEYYLELDRTEAQALYDDLGGFLAVRGGLKP